MATLTRERSKSARPPRSVLFDPLRIKDDVWPERHFYLQQEQVVLSAWFDDETYVPAGNMLGKDYVAGFIIPAFFYSRLVHKLPCRIVTTSAKDDHMRVLWGEINDWIHSARIPLEAGPGRAGFRLLHQELRWVDEHGREDDKSYVKGMVAGKQSIAAMQGHHIANTGDGIPKTMFVSDESSSVPDEYYKMALTWMNRCLVIGNTWDCANYFFRHVEAGDLPRKNGNGYHRRVIRITAEDSPNIRLARAQESAGKEPTDEIIIPGVKSWGELQKNLATMDDIQKCVSLNAQFYKGKGLKLFPSEWLDLAASLTGLPPRRQRQAKAIGIDPAEGGDQSAFAVVDEYGILEMISEQTPRTTDVGRIAKELIRRWNVPPEKVVFDAGGGGLEHADYLRDEGLEVSVVAFGESVVPLPRTYLTTADERKHQREERYTYFNRRAEMYGALSMLLDPAWNPQGFSIPPKYMRVLRPQLAPVPKKYDGEGRLKLPPKNKRDGAVKEVCLVDLIGHSPDEADALVLAVHGLLKVDESPVAGAA